MNTKKVRFLMKNSLLKNIEQKEPQSETPKGKKKVKKPSAAKRAISKTIPNQLLSREFFIKNLTFFVFITILLVFYIGYGYYVDRISRNIIELEDRSRILEAELASEKSHFNQQKMFYRISDSLIAKGFIHQAPKKIKVSADKFPVIE